MPRTPSYCRQRFADSPDYAYVTINGKRISLGRYDTLESKERYDRLIAQWMLNGRQLPVKQEEALVKNLLAAFYRYAEGYYKTADGTPTSTIFTVRTAVRMLRKYYATEPVTAFGPSQLRVLQQMWIQQDMCRRTVNDYINMVKRIFKWGVSYELVPHGVYDALRTVEGLRRYRSAARETEPVRPAPLLHIEAIKPYVSRQVWALIQIGLHTGARPGEYLALRPIDLNMHNDVWTYEPSHHKTAYRGQYRIIYFGPHAQQAIQPFLSDRQIDSCLFSPREAELERKTSNAKCHRHKNQKPNPKLTERIVGAHYTVDSFRRAIDEGCKKANVPSWSPNQLRHNAATHLREEFGIDVAGTILGHSIASSVTAIYAENSAEKAMAAIRRIG